MFSVFLRAWRLPGAGSGRDELPSAAGSSARRETAQRGDAQQNLHHFAGHHAGHGGRGTTQFFNRTFQRIKSVFTAILKRRTDVMHLSENKPLHFAHSGFLTEAT